MFNIFSWYSSKECSTKNSKFHIGSKIYSEVVPCSQTLCQLETNQSVWITSQLTGFYMIKVFTERCFPTDFSLM